ncbi:MAG: TetR/AcrR family transcriptional regulator [Eubacterium sp.]
MEDLLVETKHEGLTHKGKRTRENIVNVAKDLFYHNGYNNTGIQDIAEKAEVKLGTMTYYFKKKNNLVSEIYNTYFMELYNDVAELLGKEATLFAKYCYTLVLLYNSILEDSGNARFYYEIMAKNVNRKELLYLTKTFNRSCLDFFNKTYDEYELNAFTIGNFGAQKKIFMDYYEHEIFYPKGEILRYLVTNAFKMIAIDRDTIDNTYDQALVFLENWTGKDIRFLV